MDLKVGTTPIAIMSNFIFGKVESKNPSGSIRDRIVEYVLNSYKNDSKINIGAEIVAVATNEFALSIAYFCAKKGYKLHIVANSSINPVHEKMCKIYGAKLYLFENLSYEDLLKKKDGLVEKNDKIYYVDFYNSDMNKRLYSSSICQEIKQQSVSYGKNIKRIFVFSESDYLAESLKQDFPESLLFNVDIKNGLFNFNKNKKEIVKNFNLYPEIKRGKGFFENELSINFDKVVQNIYTVASNSGLLMDYRTSALYLAAKEYPCFNNDVNLIFFYENGERYVEEITQFQK
jgi:cysteine synthase A